MSELRSSGGVTWSHGVPVRKVWRSNGCVRGRIPATRLHAIRRAVAADLEDLCAIEALTAEGADWSRRQIEAELSREKGTVLVVEEANKPVAWAVCWHLPFELHLLNIAVHPAHRRRGYARGLLDTLFTQYRRGAEVALLELRATNEPAMHLYQSFGFQRVGLRKKYYHDGTDAVLMTLVLPSVAG